MSADAEVTGADPGADDAVSPIESILAGLAVTGLDLDRARHLVSLRAGRRLRRRRLTLTGAGALLAVALAVVLWPRPEPREVVAADASTTTTSTSSTTTTTVAPTITTVPTTMPITTAAPVITTVPTTMPTTTVAPNRPMTATAQVLTSPVGVPVQAGDNVTLRVNWSDPDLADASAVVVRADFGDPLVALPADSSTRPPCNQAGPGASGVVDVPFRFASSGALVIKVDVTACGGGGTYGEHQTVQVPVQVQVPDAGRRVVVVAGGDGRSPDAAAVLAGRETVPKRVPDLTQVIPDGTTRATVAVIDATYAGPLYLRWGDPPAATCQVSAADQSVTAGATPLTVRLAPGPAPSCPTQNVGAATP